MFYPYNNSQQQLQTQQQQQQQQPPPSSTPSNVANSVIQNNQSAPHTPSPMPNQQNIFIPNGNGNVVSHQHIYQGPQQTPYYMQQQVAQTGAAVAVHQLHGQQMGQQVGQVYGSQQQQGYIQSLAGGPYQGYPVPGINYRTLFYFILLRRP